MRKIAFKTSRIMKNSRLQSIYTVFERTIQSRIVWAETRRDVSVRKIIQVNDETFTL